MSALAKPSLLVLLAGVAGLAGVSNALAAAGGAPAGQTRLGAAVEREIAQRDRDARARDRALDLREQAARAAAARLAGRVQASPAANPAATPATGAAPTPATPAPGPGRMRTNEASEPAPQPQYDQLARIYQAMKPKQAAPVFEQLSLEVQIAVARRMRERATALLLAQMQPANAARLSMALAGRRAAGDNPAQAGRALASTR